MTEASDTRTRSRLAQGLIIAGAAISGLLAAAFMALGGLALWGDSERDRDGYLSTESHLFQTDTRALATDNLDIDLDGAGWLLDTTDFGDVKLDVAPRGDKPLFVGIARTSDVDRYLAGVDHTVVSDVDYSPFEATYRERGGDRRVAAPAGRDIWDASSRGAGSRELTWEVRDGDWSVVVMNADGSPGVDADISAGAKVSFLDEAGWSALGAGVGMFLLAGLLIVVAARPPRSGPGSPVVSSPVATA